MRYQKENFNGNYDFRCNYHNGWAIDKHLHEYSELLYCKKGTCTVIINGNSVTLPEKHLIWVPPNYIHQYCMKDAQVICAVFSRDLIPLFFHTIKNRRLIVSAIAAGELAQILERFHTLKNENLLKISGYLNLICAKVLEQSEFETASSENLVLYQDIITYLSEHFREDISLKSVAKQFGYNEKYLSHSLHMLTGIHFNKVLSLYRIEHAKKLLNQQQNSITTIATESGFSAINTFNRVFKEMTGVTPSQYRKGITQPTH